MGDIERRLISAIQTEVRETLKETGHDWVKQTVIQTVPAAVEATLLRLGMDCTHPIECQKDMAHLRAERAKAENGRRIVWETAVRWSTQFGLAGLAAYLGVKFGTK